MGTLGVALSVALLSASGTAPPKQGDKTADQKIVCRNVTEAGSRIPFRVCRTAGEWESMAKQNQDDWTGSRNSRTVGCNMINCV